VTPFTIWAGPTIWSPAAGGDLDAAHRIDEFGETIHIDHHVPADIQVQNTRGSIHHGFGTGVFGGGVEVAMVLCHIGVQAVDNAVVAAVIPFGVGIPERRVRGKL